MNLARSDGGCSLPYFQSDGHKWRHTGMAGSYSSSEPSSTSEFWMGGFVNWNLDCDLDQYSRISDHEGSGSFVRNSVYNCVLSASKISNHNAYAEMDALRSPQIRDHLERTVYRWLSKVDPMTVPPTSSSVVAHTNTLFDPLSFDSVCQERNGWSRSGMDRKFKSVKTRHENPKSQLWKESKLGRCWVNGRSF